MKLFIFPALTASLLVTCLFADTSVDDNVLLSAFSNRFPSNMRNNESLLIRSNENGTSSLQTITLNETNSGLATKATSNETNVELLNEEATLKDNSNPTRKEANSNETTLIAGLSEAKTNPAFVETSQSQSDLETEMSVTQLTDLIPTIFNISINCNLNVECIVKNCRSINSNSSFQISQQKCISLVSKTNNMTIDDYHPQQDLLCDVKYNNEVIPFGNNGTIVDLMTIIDRFTVTGTAIISTVNVCLVWLAYIFRQKLKLLMCNNKQGYTKTNDTINIFEKHDLQVPFIPYKKRNSSYPIDIESEVIEIK